MDQETLLLVMLDIAEKTEGDEETRYLAFQELFKEIDGENDHVQKPKVSSSPFEKSFHFKAGFTGQKPDNTGRVQCFVGGIHVPCAGRSPISSPVSHRGGKTTSRRGISGGAKPARASGQSKSKYVHSRSGGSVFVSVGRPDHLGDQILARKIYSLFINSDLKPELKDTSEGKAIVVPVPEGSIPLKDNSSPEVLTKLRGSFILDAFLSNWSLVGEDFTHVMVDTKGKVYRMDMTGCLRFHEDGNKKSPEEFSEQVIEVETFLDPSIHPDLAKTFQGLEPWDQEIQRQVKILLSKQKEILSLSSEILRPTLEGRLRYLQDKLPSQPNTR